MASAPDLNVVISGCGFAGLVLSILLERANIKYTILERSPEIKQFGSAIILGPNSLHLMDQLGFYQDIRKFAIPSRRNVIYDDNLNYVGALSREILESRYGYPALVTARFDLLNYFLSKVPKEKLLMGKHVTSVEHAADSSQESTVHCADGTTYKAHLVVGADGAYSGVRKSMYKEMKAANLLPAVDQEPMRIDNICLVGVTQPLSIEKFPMIDDPDCHFRLVASSIRPSTTVMINVPGRRICWMVSFRMTPEERKNLEERNSGWSNEDALELCEEIKDYVSPFGGVIGDFFNLTDKTTISKVMLEEKFFTTWSYKRSVIIGDACHKISPTTGQGASQGILDALALANCLYEMKSTSQTDLSKTLKIYYNQRSPIRLAAVASSMQFARIFDQGFVASLLRKLVLGMPQFMQVKLHDKVQSDRPQAIFLPFTEDKGILKRTPQRQAAKLVTPLVKSRDQDSKEPAVTV